MSIFQLAQKYFVCPNDGGKLESLSHALICRTCNEKFKIINENTVDLVSKNSPIIELNSSTDWYRNFYSNAKKTRIGDLPSSLQYTPFSKVKRFGFMKQALKIIQKFTKNQFVCDIGAGRGDYSLALANQASLVFHCDLDMKAINTARKEANKLRLKNIIFVRCDYFHLPFHPNSIPFITCFGSLLRGKDHDEKILEQFSRIVKKDGMLFVDFVGKERTKITHAKFQELKYTKNELSVLFDRFNLKIIKIQGLSYIIIPTVLGHLIRKLPFSIYNIIDSFSKLFFPPSRWFVVGHKTS